MFYFLLIKRGFLKLEPSFIAHLVHSLGFVAMHSLAISVNVEVILSVEVIEQGSTNTFSEIIKKKGK